MRPAHPEREPTTPCRAVVTTEAGHSTPVRGRAVRVAPGDVRTTNSGPTSAKSFAGRMWLWLLGGAIVVGAAVAFVVLTGLRPAFDAYGWLVWGRQALHWNLNTNSSPSWKPLPFLFTLPYSVLGRDALWLWFVTAVAGAIAAPIFAARVAFKLTGPARGRSYPKYVAGASAGAGVLGIAGYWHHVMIANSDPMVAALCLACIDCRLCERGRLAWWLLVLAALGRPEVWPVTALYAAWEWRATPWLRRHLVGGLAAIPLAWFVIPALTSPSWLIAGDIAHGNGAVLTGNRFAGTLSRFTSLYELPMQLAALSAIALAVILRSRLWLVLIGAAAVSLATEIAFAYRGLPTPARYMFEPAAVMIVLAGAALGQVLVITSTRILLHVAAAAGIITLVVTLVPIARMRVLSTRNGIVRGRTSARRISRLETVIHREGARRILACGQPVTTVPFHSILAWELGVNLNQVGWAASELRTRRPVVLFRPYRVGWHIRPVHIPPAARSRCVGVRTNTPSG